MNSKRVLTIQDISCLGQCSLTVALPIISACGLETVILPSAVLSNHTGGFKSWTFRDLTDEEKDLFMYNFEKQIVPFCDGVLAGDPVCLDYLSDAGVALADEAPGDRECWELLKEAVLAQK